MITAEQHEQVAHWLLFRGQATTLKEARGLLDRAIARAKAKRESAARAEIAVEAVRAVEERYADALRPDESVTGADVVAATEAELREFGIDPATATYDEVVDAGLRASAKRNRESVVSSRRYDADEHARREAVCAHVEAGLRAQGKSVTDLSEREYVLAFETAERELGLTTKEE